MIKIKPTHRIPFYLLIGFTLFWVCFALVRSISQSRKEAGDFPEIAQRGVLRVCGEEDLFSFHLEGDSLQGFHYEMMKAFAEKHHLKLEYTGEASLKNRLKLLNSDKCDVLAGPLPIVSLWRDQLDFTLPILESKWVLVQRISNRGKQKEPIRNQVDLRGKRIAVSDNPAILMRMEHLESEISDTIYTEEMPGISSERLLSLVSIGMEDYAVCDKQVAKAYRKRYRNLDIQTPIGFNQLQAWAVKPGRKALLDSLNVFIAEYKKSPAFTRLFKKYIPQD